MRVAEIMTSPVVGIDRSALISEAAKLMLDNRISGLPVVDRDKRLVGVVTEGDFLRRSELDTTKKRPRWLEFFLSAGKEANEYVRANTRKVEDVMTPNPITISPDASLEELVELMTANGIKRVPAVDKDKLVGIVARADLVRALLRAFPVPASTIGDDERIRKDIEAELGKRVWSSALRVKVTHGIAELSGVILDERLRAAARVAAENVPGVKNVIDQIAWIEPMSGLYILPDPPQKA
jgi:CBS domain-containing protein